ncbi:CHAD domain-containing protein [Acinetobacter sp. ANC 3813]|uniref:CYTH and CHAD domain-containing protein n=1 Tax=Acinetobacter sp. ANC 3813 TaxID=1977873 RepID=UPI000A3386C5|nr:CHAD domain-containing protein [Acinetobacter sp. ANC 3813]OTG91629.1 inorganic triphosphatase [Acinetobacter sp. ANC 3813]
MSEIELKFQIPASKRTALARAVQKLKPEPLQLHAKYFDTDEFHLYKCQMSLRLRLENEEWRQTLKLPKNNIERLEIETEAQNGDSINLQPYLKDKKLRNVLPPISESSLRLQFETQVHRSRIIQQINNSQIEIAYDIGNITALHQKDSGLAIDEIEFELKSGCVEDLIQSIRPWVNKYQLWLDRSSKALKGYSLTQQSFTLPVQTQTAVNLNKHADCNSALQDIIANCLEHLLPNSSAIALNQYTVEHVHQARVAVRRLRSALKIFNFDPNLQQQTRIWQKLLADIFKGLGGTRDRDALAETLIPELKAVGSPIVELPASVQPAEKIDLIFQAKETTFLLLELIEFAYTPQPRHQKLKVQLNKKLNKMHKQICAAQIAFEQMHDEEKHRLRKQVKTLRYCIEFSAALYAPSAVKAYLKALKPLQEDLGRFNDLTVAHALFNQNLDNQPEIWFVLGWIAAEKSFVQQKIQANLKSFSQVQTFWTQ